MTMPFSFFWSLLLSRNTAASPPRLIKSFSAVQSGYSWATGAVNNTISGTILVDASIPGQVQSQALPDGRSVHVVFNYDTVNKSNAGVFSLQPFFEERVCYIYPLPVGRGYKPLVFNDALIEIWCQQAGLCMSTYNISTYIGMSKGVDGTPCQEWRYGTSSAEMTTFCVTEAGALLDVAFDYHDKRIDVVARTHFSNFTTKIDPADFAIPNRDLCVDLRAFTPTKDEGERLVNEANHIAIANDEALGLWSAAPSAVFEGYTLEEASSRLGLMTGFGFSLELPTVEHLDSIEETVRSKGGVPSTFDARDEWGDACSSIEKIRNQGDCGGCWAFSAAEVLADRFCIAASKSNLSQFRNLSLSPQWVLDCDKTNRGCGGGLLDDAWKFLESTGAVTEQCDPYLYCAHPVSPSCETGPHPPRPVPGPRPCPKTCRNTSALERKYRSLNAYAVSTPGWLFRAPALTPTGTANPDPNPDRTGNVEAMQKELMAHGPIQVGFQVFSDFMTYKNGTYFRTPSAQGPRGGHAVKIVGWGVDRNGIGYWTVANSWSPLWGMQGFFRIRRGTNECGIETTPAAGLAALD